MSELKFGPSLCNFLRQSQQHLSELQTLLDGLMEAGCTIPRKKSIRKPAKKALTVSTKKK